MSHDAVLISTIGRRIAFELDTWQALWCMACKAGSLATGDFDKGVQRDGSWITEDIAIKIANDLAKFLKERSRTEVRRWIVEEFGEDRDLQLRAIRTFLSFCKSSGGFAIGGLE